jgi:hypothetical protein
MSGGHRNGTRQASSDREAEREERRWKEKQIAVNVGWPRDGTKQGVV